MSASYDVAALECSAEHATAREGAVEAFDECSLFRGRWLSSVQVLSLLRTTYELCRFLRCFDGFIPSGTG